MTFKKNLTPDVSLVQALPTDTNDLLWQRVKQTLPKIIADLARRVGEERWAGMPGGMQMDQADRARLIRETADAYQRNLTQREMNDIADEVLRQVTAWRDASKR